MIKLIATDVDGTLVKDGTMTINPEYMTVIRKLTELGITFVVCSGRQYDSERKLSWSRRITIVFPLISCAHFSVYCLRSCCFFSGLS